MTVIASNERTAVDVPSYVGPVVKEFHVQAVVGPEPESLGDIVDLGGKYVVRFVEFKLPCYLQQRGPFLELLARSGVLAENLYHVLYFKTGSHV